MGLFDKKKVELPPLISDEELDAVNYDQVVDYLVGLNRYDFERIIKVANIYRNANRDVSKLLGLKDVPTATIVKQSQSEAEIEAVPAFLETPVSKPAKKPKP